MLSPSSLQHSRFPDQQAKQAGAHTTTPAIEIAAPPSPDTAAVLGPASAPAVASTDPSEPSKHLTPNRPTTRPISFNSRLSDLEQIHDKIRQRLAIKKGQLPTETGRSQSTPPQAVLDKTLNTGETNYSAVVSAYTLGSVRGALAPDSHHELDDSDHSEADSQATVSAVASTVLVDTPATSLTSSVFDISSNDGDMGKKNKGKRAAAIASEEDETEKPFINSNVS